MCGVYLIMSVVAYSRFFLARDNIYVERAIYYRPSVCLSQVWISQNRLWLRRLYTYTSVCNFHLTVAPSL